MFFGIIRSKSTDRATRLERDPEFLKTQNEAHEQRKQHKIDLFCKKYIG